MTKFPKLLGVLLMLIPLKGLNSFTEYVDISSYRICYAKDSGGCLSDPAPQPEDELISDNNSEAQNGQINTPEFKEDRKLSVKGKSKRNKAFPTTVADESAEWVQANSANSQSEEEISYRAGSSRKTVNSAGVVVADDAIRYAINLVPVADSYESYNGYKPDIKKGSYKTVLSDIKKHKQFLSDALDRSKSPSEKHAIIQDASNLFSDAFLNHIMPFWYGTPWDFDGHTDIPGRGQIACGYLVSTTLNHLGVNVNRYSLAQQWPIDIVRSLCMNDYYHYAVKSQAIEGIRNMGYGLYVLGLDNHVGFVKYDEWGVHFIHSNWAGSQTVVSEDPQYSTAFTSSKNYYVGKLTENETFITKWLQATGFKVQKG
ncbi:MAG: hypothetical protein IPM47_16540 [Sphingobacteriales bacterium]|nr:MAG: hypothetical protein IPM47_16540 [Sphingobacteriales bacterium]